MYEYSRNYDADLLVIICKAKMSIPPELRISGSCFTGIALVGSCDAESGHAESGHNHSHSHRDSNDVISLFVTLGDDSVTGGRALYYDGGKAFKRTDPYSNCGNIVAVNTFVNVNYQIGPFEHVVQAGQPWYMDWS